MSYEKVSSISLRGFYAPGTNRIVVNEILSDTQRLSTLSHEIGHMLEKHGERDVSTAQKEFEADSISILIQSHFGMELTDARKDHLADHYREFKKELEQGRSDLSEEDQIKKIDEALSASMAVFRKHIGQIQEFVEHRIESLNNSIPLNHEEVTENGNAEIKRYTFTVNECNEFPEMGNIYAEIPTGLAALELFTNIPDYKRNMVPGIELAIDSSKGNLYSMSIPLLAGNTVDVSMLEYYEPMQTDPKAAEIVMDFVEQAKKAGYEIYGEFSPGEQEMKRNARGR